MRPMIELIVAITRNSCIGDGNKLPWSKMRGDMRFFKETTIGKSVIMGRKTFESIGKALPNRVNIVVSSTLEEEDLPSGVHVGEDIQHAIEIAHKYETIPTLIGGGSIYSEAVNIADVMYVTVVNTELNGDTYFPDIGFRDWDREIVGHGLADENNDYDYTIHKLIRT